jgi:SOUL heme-binding protein
MFQSFLNFLWSVVFFVSSAFGISMSTEQQRYDVIEKIDKNIEIRQYPTRIVAETTVDASKSANPRGDAFNIVAAYIFGANKARRYAVFHAIKLFQK